MQGSRVTLDGVDVRYLPQTQLRLALGIVPQVRGLPRAWLPRTSA